MCTLQDVKASWIRNPVAVIPHPVNEELTLALVRLVHACCVYVFLEAYGAASLLLTQGLHTCLAPFMVQVVDVATKKLARGTMELTSDHGAQFVLEFLREGLQGLIALRKENVIVKYGHLLHFRHRPLR
jgi:hypothetical protein